MATLNWRNEIHLVLFSLGLFLLSTPVAAQNNGEPSRPDSAETVAGAHIQYKLEVDFGERFSRTYEAELMGGPDLYRVEFEIPRLTEPERKDGEKDTETDPGGGEGEDASRTDSENEKDSSGESFEPERFWMVVDRGAGEMTLVFPPTKLAQTIELEALEPEETPPALGFFAQGREWLERFRKAVEALKGNNSGSDGSGGDGDSGDDWDDDRRLSEEITVEQLDEPQIAGAAGEGYRISAPGAAGLEVVFSRDNGFPLGLSASSGRGSQRAALTAHSVTQSTFSRSELTAVPGDFQSLRAEKVADLVLIHLFEKLASSPRSARRLSVSDGGSEEQSE